MHTGYFHYFIHAICDSFLSLSCHIEGLHLVLILTSVSVIFSWPDIQNIYSGSLMCYDLQHISHNVSFALCQSLNEQKVATASCWSIDWNGQCWNEICSLNTDRLQLLYLSLSVEIMIWESLVPHWTVKSRTYKLNHNLITNLVVMDDVNFLMKFLSGEW